MPFSPVSPRAPQTGGAACSGISKYQLVVEDKRWETFKAKLKEITRKTKPMSFDQRMHKLKEVHRGWINYFKFASILNKLNELDGWLRNRVRYCIWHDWKKPERKRKNLIRLGVLLKTAFLNRVLK
jgi:hypothetical protein